MEEPTINLDQQRDEKCVPVARGFLLDMATDLVPEDPANVDYQPITSKLLARSLSADLNITTEASYVFQLCLTALSGLNLAMQEAAKRPTDEARYAGIAKKLLSIVATADVRLTNVTPEDTKQDFAPVKEQVEALFAEEKLTELEMEHVRGIIFDAFKSSQEIFGRSLEQNIERAEAKALGVAAMTDLTMKHVDDVLKS